MYPNSTVPSTISKIADMTVHTYEQDANEEVQVLTSEKQEIISRLRRLRTGAEPRK